MNMTKQLRAAGRLFRRIEFGGGYPVFWASYAAHPLVDFTKTVNLKASDRPRRNRDGERVRE